MNIDSWLSSATDKLHRSNIATARLDCLVLLADELGRDKSWILAHAEDKLQIKQVTNLSTKIAQRARHTPLAYVRGKTEFYGRDFIVNRRVLEPRPESETLINLLKQLNLAAGSNIADIGTGSGALAVTAILEMPTHRVIATDIDKNCLLVAAQNAKKHGADIGLIQGNLLEALLPLSERFSPAVLLCNLPYVPDDFHINLAAGHEPRRAIFGGRDGLDVYRTLFRQVVELLSPPHYILTESMPPQQRELTQIAAEAGYKLESADDFIQLFSPVSQR